MVKCITYVICVAGMLLSSIVFSDEEIERSYNKKMEIERGISKELHFSMIGYCMQFNQIPQEMTGVMIKELESIGASPEQYLMAPVCQPRFYSNSVASPMLHLIADDPTKHYEKLNNIWLYYLKKRKQPEIFNELLNAKNTLGETFLDYLLKGYQKNNYLYETQLQAVATLVQITCEHGGRYATTKFEGVDVSSLNPRSCVSLFMSKMK